jgi:hypothetical protein
MKGKLIKSNGIYTLMCGDKMFASNDLDFQVDYEIEKLSTKNCQVIENGYDLDELSKECIINDENISPEIKRWLIIAFKHGFQKCNEMNSNKKFTEGDVMLGWDAGVMSKTICDSMYLGLRIKEQLAEHREFYQKDLKPVSLKQTEWNVEIITKKVLDGFKMVGVVKGVKGSGSKINMYKYLPKLDKDGCLILKKINV